MPVAVARRYRFIVPAAAVTLAATIAASPRQAKPPVAVHPAVMSKSVGDMTADEELQFSDAAEATIRRVCLTCHPVEIIVKTRRTAREWNDQLTVMRGRGAIGTDPDFAAIGKYLTRYFGLVHVNTATAEELTSVLGLSARDAKAIVDYRAAHGTFADLASLERVAGVDRTKLDDQPDALRFD